MSFENSFGLALLLINVGLIAVPYVSGEETISSLVHNRLALLGAAALILFVIYRIAAVIKEFTAPRQLDATNASPSRPGEKSGQTSSSAVLPDAVQTDVLALSLKDERVIVANVDNLQSRKAS
jgi:hypothetical protein